MGAGAGALPGGSKQPVNIDGEKRDHRMDNNPEYWQHSEASLQFQKVPPCLHLSVSCLGTPHSIASSKMAVCFAVFQHHHISHQVTGKQHFCISVQ